MYKQNDIFAAVKHIKQKLDAVKEQSGGKLLCATWSIDNEGKVVLVDRTSWDFPIDGFSQAVGQLIQDLMQDYANVKLCGMFERKCTPLPQVKLSTVEEEKFEKCATNVPNFSLADKLEECAKKSGERDYQKIIDEEFANPPENSGEACDCEETSENPWEKLNASDSNSDSLEGI